MPKVSVIIPTYNRPHLFPKAVDSVLKQTFTDFEIIVVDDGSTKPVGYIVNQYNDSRLRYIYQENSGLVVARNNGVFAADSKYIAFLDDDDRFLPHKLDVQVALLEANPNIGLALGGYINEDSKGKLFSENQPWLYHDPNDIKTWLYGCPTIPSVPLIRTAWFNEIGGFDNNLKFTEDADLWLRLAFSGCRMAFVQSIVSIYYINPVGMARNAIPMRNGWLQVINNFYSTPGIPNELLEIKEEVLSAAYIIGAMREIGIGAIKQAQDDISMAFHLDKTLIEKPDFILETIVNFAVDPNITEHPYSYTKTVFSNLPNEAEQLKCFEKQVLGQVISKLLFEAHKQNDIDAMRQNLALLIMHNKSHFFDRGILSVTVEAFLGFKIAQIMRILFGRNPNNIKTNN
ncbi:glycosyltransferase family 2 protein [Chloroflexota bacterium]